MGRLPFTTLYECTFLFWKWKFLRNEISKKTIFRCNLQDSGRAIPAVREKFLSKRFGTATRLHLAEDGVLIDSITFVSRVTVIEGNQ